VTPGRAAREARGLGALVLVLLSAALAPLAAGACGGRSDLDLRARFDDDDAGRGGAAGASGEAGLGGEAGGAPLAGTGGAAGAGGCADCTACGACVDQGETPACASSKDACLAAPGCAALDACARTQRCLDQPNFLESNTCISRCTVSTAAPDADVDRWFDYVRCATCVPGCLDACPSTKPLCSLAGASGAGGTNGTNGAGGAGAGGSAGLSGAGSGGSGGSGGELNECGACVAETGPALCTTEIAACGENAACSALDACLRTNCLTQPLEQFPFCALLSCGPFLLDPSGLDRWNRYAQCSICDTACYPTCQPWSEALCLLDGDPARSLLGPLAPAALSCSGL
jgi:hypothetical protein